MDVTRMAAKSLMDDPRTSGGWELLSGMPNWTRANEIWQQKTTRELEQMYGAQIVVFACVRKICLSAQEAPLEVGVEKPRGWIDKPNHPLCALLAQPNPEMHYAEFLWYYLGYLMLTGEAHAWKWRNGAGEVVQTWPLPKSFVRAIRAGGLIDHYEIYQGPNKPWMKVARTDIIRSVLPDLGNPGCGLGPLQAALNDVQTDNERADYMIEMITNTRTPGTVVKTADEIPEEKQIEMSAMLNAGLGRGRRGRTTFLWGDQATLEQAVPMKDFHWDALAKFGESRICSAFGVHPMLVGLSAGNESSTLANFEIARKVLFQDTIAPLWSLLDSSFTKGLLRDEGDASKLEIYHDTDNVRALIEDQDKRAERAGKLFSGGLTTRNEAREMAGLDALPPEQGDVFVLPMNLVETPLGAPAPAAPVKDDGSKVNENL